MRMKNRFVPPEIGDHVTFRKTMTVAEQAMFTGISGNLGHLYVDRNAAKAVGLADMAIFELAGAALLTTCLARLAGPGYRIAEISTRFTQALVVGTTVEATARLVAREGQDLLFSLVLDVAGATVSTGEARLVPVEG